MHALMNRIVMLGLAVWAVTTLGQESPNLQKISKHVYAYAGTTNASPTGNAFGANVGVVIGRDAVLVIDTLISAKAATRLLEQIRAVTDKPIKYVVNTHDHLDHAWGNCVFAKLGAIIIAQENSRLDANKTGETLGRAGQYGLTAADMEGTTIVPPSITFKQSVKVDLGGITVELNYPGPSHTVGSITALVPQDKVLFVGDILFSHYHPYLAEGDLAGWQQALIELESTIATKIIPGHGPVSTVSDLRDMREYIRVFDTEARKLCAGKTAADAPVIAKELLKLLPDQGRTELPMMVQANLAARFLPKSNH